MEMLEKKTVNDKLIPLRGMNTLSKRVCEQRMDRSVVLIGWQAKWCIKGSYYPLKWVITIKSEKMASSVVCFCLWLFGHKMSLR